MTSHIHPRSRGLSLPNGYKRYGSTEWGSRRTGHRRAALIEKKRSRQRTEGKKQRGWKGKTKPETIQAHAMRYNLTSKNPGKWVKREGVEGSTTPSHSFDDDTLFLPIDTRSRHCSSVKWPFATEPSFLRARARSRTEHLSSPPLRPKISY